MVTRQFGLVLALEKSRFMLSTVVIGFQCAQRRTIERGKEYAADTIVVIGPSNGVVLAPRIEELKRHAFAAGHLPQLALHRFQQVHHSAG